MGEEGISQSTFPSVSIQIEAKNMNRRLTTLEEMKLSYENIQDYKDAVLPLLTLEDKVKRDVENAKKEDEVEVTWSRDKML